MRAYFNLTERRTVSPAQRKLCTFVDSIPNGVAEHHGVRGNGREDSTTVVTRLPQQADLVVFMAKKAGLFAMPSSHDDKVFVEIYA